MSRPLFEYGDSAGYRIGLRLLAPKISARLAGEAMPPGLVTARAGPELDPSDVATSRDLSSPARRRPISWVFTTLRERVGKA